MRVTDDERLVSVLFVCHDNAALSLLAESIVRSLGNRRFTAASAGTQPVAAPKPLVIDFLQQRHMPIDGLRSKGLHEACAGRRFDFMVSLCGHSAAALGDERQVRANWNLEDLAEELEDPFAAPHAVRDAFWILMRRIKIFASLPHHLPRRAIQHRLDSIPAWS